MKTLICEIATNNPMSFPEAIGFGFLVVGLISVTILYCIK